MKEIIIIIIAFILLIILFGVSVDYQKTQCIQSGGNWVTGMVGGEFSYFCMPK